MLITLPFTPPLCYSDCWDTRILLSNVRGKRTESVSNGATRLVVVGQVCSCACTCSPWTWNEKHSIIHLCLESVHRDRRWQGQNLGKTLFGHFAVLVFFLFIAPYAFFEDSFDLSSSITSWFPLGKALHHEISESIQLWEICFMGYRQRLWCWQSD